MSGLTQLCNENMDLDAMHQERVIHWRKYNCISWLSVAVTITVDGVAFTILLLLSDLA